MVFGEPAIPFMKVLPRFVDSIDFGFARVIPNIGRLLVSCRILEFESRAPVSLTDWRSGPVLGTFSPFSPVDRACLLTGGSRLGTARSDSNFG
jgi:hypothetical protein